MISKHTHTPGPWQVKPGTFNIYPAKSLRVSDRIATVDTCVDIEEEQANAALIAAAPDLLAALNDCVRYLNKPTDYSGELIAIHDAARAAIAKATNI